MRLIVNWLQFLSIITFLIEDSTANPVSSYSNHHYDQYRNAEQHEIIKRQSLWIRMFSGFAVPFLLIVASFITTRITRKYFVMSALCLSVLQFCYVMF